MVKKSLCRSWATKSSIDHIAVFGVFSFKERDIDLYCILIKLQIVFDYLHVVCEHLIRKMIAVQLKIDGEFVIIELYLELLYVFIVSKQDSKKSRMHDFVSFVNNLKFITSEITDHGESLVDQIGCQYIAIEVKLNFSCRIDVV